MQTTLVVSRHGRNLFATGLYGAHGAVLLVPVLTAAVRAVDRTHYIHAELHGRHGMRIEIRRRRNDEVIRRITSRCSTVRVRVSAPRRGVASC